MHDRSTRETIELEEPYLYFEACMDLVDSGELTQQEAIAKYCGYFGIVGASETEQTVADEQSAE